jgi:hypothetical protein
LEVESRLRINYALFRKDSEYFRVDVRASSGLPLRRLLPLIAKGFEVGFDTHDGVIDGQSLSRKSL